MKKEQLKYLIPVLVLLGIAATPMFGPESGFTQLLKRCSDVKSWRAKLGIGVVPINVTAEPYLAKGDGVSDDTTAVQSAIDAAAAVHETVLFPPGIYLVRGLSATPGIRGMKGNCIPGTKRQIQLPSMLRLADSANTNLLYVPEGSYLDITGLGFDGNRTNQTAAADMVVITNAVYTGNIRNEMHIYGCSFVNSSRDGLSINREEVYVGNCMALWNSGDGVAFHDATDCTYGDDTGSGFNGGNGVGLYGNTSSCRFFHFDAFSNHGSGLYIDGGSGIGDDTFIRGQCNNNFQFGLLMTNIAANLKFTLCKFEMSNYYVDGQGATNAYPSGTFSDVMIAGSSATNRLYLTDLDFSACDFGLKSGSPLTNALPRYAIEDTRSLYNTNEPAGSGITIHGGMIGNPDYYAWGDPIFNHDVFQQNATIVGLKNPSGYQPYGPGRLGAGNLSIGGSLIVDGNGRMELYQVEPGCPYFRMDTIGGTNYSGWDQHGTFMIPGGFIAQGKSTNNGVMSIVGYLDMGLPGTNLPCRIYPIGASGGIGRVTGLGTGTTNFWGDLPDGTSQFPGGIKLSSQSAPLTASLVGGNGWFLYPSNAVLYAAYSADGTNITTLQQIAPTP